MRISQIFIFILLLMPLAVFSQGWSIVGNGNNLTGPAANIWSIKTDTTRNVLYVGGCFDSIDGNAGHHIGNWNSIFFSNMGSGVDAGSYYGVIASEIYNGDYYAAGRFHNADGVPANYIAKWNGVNWDSVGGGLNGWVACLKVFNGELYAGGAFTHAGNLNVYGLAKWNGVSWDSVGNYSIGYVCGMEVYNGQLYAATADAGTSTLYVLNNNTWFDLVVQRNLNPLGGLGMSGMAVYNGELYIGGVITVAGTPVNGIAKWNGTNWSDVGDGLSYNNYNTTAAVCAMKVYHGELYAAGQFSTAGNIQCSNIAKWNGQSWSSVGSGTDGAIISLDVFQNALYVGGWFSTAGNLPSNLIAKWETTVSIPEYFPTEKSISVSPNPSSGEFFLSINSNWNSNNFTIQITDVVGKIVSEYNSTNHTISINLNNQAKGIYFMKVIGENNQSSIKKIVLQ